MNEIEFALWRTKNFMRGVLPWVSRRKLARVEREHRQMLEAIPLTPRASVARIVDLQASRAPARDDVCLFVTHADRPELKRHVVDHIDQLLATGVDVALVANTGVPADALRIDARLQGRLFAAVARENIGFDFAAWSHAMAHCLGGREVERLYLVNDSMVGPLNAPAFQTLIGRVRASRADVIGLTDNAWPRPHLQSYFLVFSRRAQASDTYKAIFADALAFASKEHVIMVYETQVTALLERAGLATECLFPALQHNPRYTSYVHHLWQDLVERGMPFVKTSIVREHADDPTMIALVPEVYRAEVCAATPAVHAPAVR